MILELVLLILNPNWSSKFCSIKPPEVDISIDVYDVVVQGAVGDGVADDSMAFQNVWMKVCQGNSIFPVFIIPSGKNFLLSPVTFKGPCRSPKIVVKVLGNIVAPDQISAWGNNAKHSWIDFSHIDGMTIHGPGMIDGQGLTWWNQSHDFKLDSCNRVELSRLKHINSPRNHISIHNRVELSRLKHINSPRNHISIHNSTDVIVSNINITSPGSSHNTDGIDISRSTYIRIQDSFIGTVSDDCITINGGTSYVEITNLACGPDHGIRVGVGSLGAKGATEIVENIHVQNCTFTGTQNGVRIKTWQGGSGYARHITFDQIKFVEVYNPIIIDQYYCNAKHNCKNQTSAVEVSDLYYTRIYGTSKHPKNVINLKCSQDVPCTNIVMNQINIQSMDPVKNSTGFSYNAYGISNDTTPDVTLLS
ncbi:hypothetical protein MKW98_024352 [Papaver atlanticum]|uniref:Polygalacturonase n=1 Tax=Papaver atlanticum TaxID=357466 RepID=A0AAD4T053_9MAGN|nr:hypothetical protein MKW98_024352 [Papaver atlanticum]